MEILEFRKITTQDIYDNLYNSHYEVHGKPWSRIYEYPLVINQIKKFYKPNYKIHNSSWGFEGVHITFKNKLDELFKNIYHSDIIKSQLKNTFIYDITKRPNEDEIEKYDILINVSTLEEVNHDHIDIFNNLLMQLKKGGILIITFDLYAKKVNTIKYLISKKYRQKITSEKRRVLQLKQFEALFKKRIETQGVALNGENSNLQNMNYKHLNCGLMVIRK